MRTRTVRGQLVRIFDPLEQASVPTWDVRLEALQGVVLLRVERMPDHYSAAEAAIRQLGDGFRADHWTREVDEPVLIVRRRVV